MPVRSAGPVDVRVEIAGPLAKGSDQHYVLRDGDGVVTSAPNADEMLVGLQDWLDGEVTRRAPDVTIVHAGAVLWRGRAILLPGPSGSGKTRLVAALLERGAVYYSDELSPIDARGWVHPYPRRLVVRDGDGARRATSAETLTAHAGTVAVPVRLIIDVCFQAAGPWHLRPVPASEAMLQLLSNTAHRLPSAGAVPRALINVTASARSYRGTRGEAHQAADAILQLAERAVP
jgi:hypothetical protein